jgi:hypothetical protein
MLVFFINQQISTMVPEKTVHGSISQSPEKWKRAGPPHHPVVHNELPSGPQQTESLKNELRRRQLRQMTNKMTKKMRQGLKRPRNLPWPPKSVPAEVSNDERQAGYLLCPLVTVDFVTKWSTATSAGTEIIIKAEKT